MRVMSGLIVSLSPKTFNESVLRPALNRQRTLLDALHRFVAIDQSLLGFPHRFVCRLDTAVEDGRYLPFVFTVIYALVSA